MKSSKSNTPEIRPESPKGAGKMLKSTILATTALSLGMGMGVTAAFAQDATSDVVSDADIVVTARRVEERLQDVPISIQVFNQDQLDRANIVNAQDLATVTPSLAVDNRFGSDNASFALRGFTQELRTTQTVATYFADVVTPRTGSNLIDGAGAGAFFDLQNVQILKGPQGTLFGRNTTGGAVLLVPQRPTDEFGGYVEGSLGDYNLQRVQGVLNVPISETLRARFGVDRQTRDGTLNVIDSSGIQTGDLNDIDYISGRASLVWDITPNLENYTVLSYTNSDTHPAGAQVFACAPNLLGGFGLGGFFIPTASCNAQLAQQTGFHDYAQNSVPSPRNLSTLAQAINTTTWSVSDNLTIKNILSYAETESHTRNPVFGTNFNALSGAGLPFTYSTAGERPGDQPTASLNTITEELQFQGSNFDNRLKWQGGLYYEHSSPGETSGGRSIFATSCDLGTLNGDPSDFMCVNDPSLGGNLAPFGGQGGGVEDTQFWIRYTNIAAYLQTSYDITDRLTLTAGYRYTWDKTSYWEQNVLYGFANGFAYGPPDLTRTRCVSSADGLGPVPFVGGDPNNPGDACSSDGIQRSQAPTWLLGLDYKLTDDNMVYAKYSRGYRQGSVIPLGVAGFNTFGPEEVDTYEIGSKNTFRGEFPGVFNISAFLSDFRQQQLQLGLFPFSGVGTTMITNGNSSTLWGIEAEGSVELFEGFRLSAGYTYLHTNVDSSDFADLSRSGRAAYCLAHPDSVACVVSGGSPNTEIGQPLPNSPQNKASITAAYTLPTPETVGDITVSATWNITSHYQTCAFEPTELALGEVGAPYCRIPGYTTVNLNLDWNHIGGSAIDGAIFVTNLLDEKYTTFVSGTYGTGFESRSVGDPMMAGVRLRYNFGAEAN